MYIYVRADVVVHGYLRLITPPSSTAHPSFSCTAHAVRLVVSAFFYSLTRDAAAFLPSNASRRSCLQQASDRWRQRCVCKPRVSCATVSRAVRAEASIAAKTRSLRNCTTLSNNRLVRIDSADRVVCHNLCSLSVQLNHDGV